jgi:hypothetical protein
LIGKKFIFLYLLGSESYPDQTLFP